jgi:hypothetical protein
MTEVILSNDDVTVIGGPASINLDVDFGPKGDRGSVILTGDQNPNDYEFLEDPAVGDVFININTGDAEYLYMYQLIAGPSSNTWEPLLKLIPNVFAQNKEITFTDGVATTTVSVADASIYLPSLPSTPTAEDFNVQLEMINVGEPVAASVSIGSVSKTNNILSLPLTIYAASLDGSTWSAMTGETICHLSITVV